MKGCCHHLHFSVQESVPAGLWAPEQCSSLGSSHLGQVSDERTKAFLCHVFIGSMWDVFCDRFLSLGGKMLLCLKWMVTCPMILQIPIVPFFFFFKGWGHVNRTAVKIFPLQMFTSTFLSGIQPFYLWACYPTANNRVNSTSYVSDSPPVPIQPPQLKPMIMLDAFYVMLGLEMGQLKDKLLLNQSLTPLRTNRAVERV